eukprot:GHVQ01004714.1.p1 GENE.GHVQ01004714.1~~GHVQ01004714.1.p1  ORF type:complete len:111 (-),score=17.93 GHVQ01004714.1:330-662(-)
MYQGTVGSSTSAASSKTPSLSSGIQPPCSSSLQESSSASGFSADCSDILVNNCSNEPSSLGINIISATRSSTASPSASSSPISVRTLPLLLVGTPESARRAGVTSAFSWQ